MVLFRKKGCFVYVRSLKDNFFAQKRNLTLSISFQARKNSMKFSSKIYLSIKNTFFAFSYFHLLFDPFFNELDIYIKKSRIVMCYFVASSVFLSKKARSKYIFKFFLLFYFLYKWRVLHFKLLLLLKKLK